MQISTDSWHYKVVARQDWRGRAPGNLCPYMRRLFWGITKSVAKWVGIGLAALVGISVLLAPVAYVIHAFITPFLPEGWLVSNDQHIALFMLAFIIGNSAYTIAGASITFFGMKEGFERYKNSDFYRKRAALKDNAPPLPPKQPSVFVEWLKGIHNKTCSSLEFVDTPESA
jgi:hypothetical protein